MKKQILLVLLTIFILMGCQKTQYTRETAELTVSNLTGNNLQIMIKPCEDETNIFIKRADLYPGRYVIIPITHACIDAQAIDNDGKIIGTQTRLRLPPEVKWVIY